MAGNVLMKLAQRLSIIRKLFSFNFQTQVEISEDEDSIERGSVGTISQHEQDRDTASHESDSDLDTDNDSYNNNETRTKLSTDTPNPESKAFKKLGQVQKLLLNARAKNAKLIAQHKKCTVDAAKANAKRLRKLEAEKVQLNGKLKGERKKRIAAELKLEKLQRQFKRSKSNVPATSSSNYATSGTICQHCGDQFSSKNSLRRHDNSHHSGKNICCDYCDMKFVESYYLNLHLKKRHGKGKFKVNGVRCCKCGHLFPNRLLLVHHKKTEK